jgi:predicted phage terminase large subunit-like protein
MVRGHIEGPDIVPKMTLAWQTHGGSYMAVEKSTRQMNIIQEAERTGLPIRALKADKDKVARALPATARMERGTVWFPSAAMAGWYPAFEQELLAFPASKHDDMVDTLAYAVLEIAHTSPYETGGLMTL